MFRNTGRVRFRRSWEGKGALILSIAGGVETGDRCSRARGRGPRAATDAPRTPNLHSRACRNAHLKKLVIPLLRLGSPEAFDRISGFPRKVTREDFMKKFENRTAWSMAWLMAWSTVSSMASLKAWSIKDVKTGQLTRLLLKGAEGTALHEDPYRAPRSAA